ncbi:MAG: CHAT domain-containing protein [Cyanobacteria bacterium P01_A01_bin.105]
MPSVKLPLRRAQVRRVLALLAAVAFALTLWSGRPTIPGLTLHPGAAGSGMAWQPVAAQALEAGDLVDMGVAEYRAGNFANAIEQWQLALVAYQSSDDQNAIAIVSENLARAYRQVGQTTDEIDHWQLAVGAATRLEDSQRLGRLLTEQAQAYSQLGQYRRAIAILCGSDVTLTAADEPRLDNCAASSALGLSLAADDSLGHVAALGSLGEAYRLGGQNEKASAVLAAGLDQAAQLAEPDELRAALLVSLGNQAASLAQNDYRIAAEAVERGFNNEAKKIRQQADEKNQVAIDYFEESLSLAKTPLRRLQAVQSLVPLYLRSDQLDQAEDHWQMALELLEQLPQSQSKAFSIIQLADQLLQLNVSGEETVCLRQDLPQVDGVLKALLTQATELGQSLNNPRTTSFALGRLGHLYENCGEYDTALGYTQDARIAADQSLAAKDSLYLWEWQTGRILRAQGKDAAALEAYRQSVEKLEEIRSAILGTNADIQFDFRDAVEPIYREYTELTLGPVPDKQLLLRDEQQPAYRSLDTALATFDSLQVAELQNYFANDDCVIAPIAGRIDQLQDSADAAIISTALLDGKTVVVLSLPGGRKMMARVPVADEVLLREVEDFRIAVEAGRRQLNNAVSPELLTRSQQVYQWLLAPFEAELQPSEVSTLVFVNDGILRGAPMAALHDGSQFLIERFAIASAPSLTLTRPERFPREGLSALVLGLSEASQVAGQPLGALQAVEPEIEKVTAEIPDSTVLLNQAFSPEKLGQALAAKDYRILHMATHGNFGSRPDDTYIVTGAKKAENDAVKAGDNQVLTIGDLDRLIRGVSDPDRDPIELLTLTACDTAVGDSRATLGLAGVALRAGVRSAVATLWKVDDAASADLIARFYENLSNPALTKAEALQQAQLSLLLSDGAHPYKWAPFILIGNWL